MRPTTKDNGYRVYNVTQKGDCTYHAGRVKATGQVVPLCGAREGVDTRVYEPEELRPDILNCGRCHRLLGEC